MICDPRLKEIFNKYDESKDNQMDSKELISALLSLDLKISHNEANKLLLKYDNDSSGTLSFQEFCEIFSNQKLKSIFQEIDVDQNGTINCDELKDACHKLNYKLSSMQVEKLLNKVDINNDGYVTLDEFVSFFQLVPNASLKAILNKWTQEVSIYTGSDLSPPVISADVPWYYGVYGGIGGLVSRTATAPLEKVKLTAQTSVSKVSILKELKSTYIELGTKGMFAGNGCNCLRVFPYAGIVTYVYLNGLRIIPQHDSKSSNWMLEPIYRGSVGACAGIIGQLCTYPLDVIRARLTVCPTLYDYSIAKCGASIIEEHGVRGLYKGLTPTLLAVAPFLACQMATADSLKFKLAEHNIDLTTSLMLCVGASAGAVAQTFVYPLDVLRRRMQVQGNTTSGNVTVLSDSTWLAMRQVVAKEGISTLFNGIGVTYLKVLPACAIAMTVTKELIGMDKKRQKAIE